MKRTPADAGSVANFCSICRAARIDSALTYFTNQRRTSQPAGVNQYVYAQRHKKTSRSLFVSGEGKRRMPRALANERPHPRDTASSTILRPVQTRGKHMGFFKKTASGAVVFNGGRYDGQTVDEVARKDPQYLRWARKDMTIGVPDDVFDAVSAAMTVNGIPFTARRKKKD
jgi:hypothetical protein